MDLSCQLENVDFNGPHPDLVEALFFCFDLDLIEALDGFAVNVKAPPGLRHKGNADQLVALMWPVRPVLSGFLELWTGPDCVFHALRCGSSAHVFVCLSLTDLVSILEN